MSEWESSLNGPSRLVLAALRSRPGLIELASVRLEPDALGSQSIVVDLPSPTGDPHRDLSVWLDEDLIPSIEFGAWHEHADRLSDDPQAAVQALVEVAARIVDGRILLDGSCDADGWPYSVVEVDDSAPILAGHGATDPEWPLLSWSGDSDRMAGEAAAPA